MIKKLVVASAAAALSLTLQAGSAIAEEMTVQSVVAR